MGCCRIFFSPTRGIRQGDPISPYLFLLCAEGLSCLLKAVGHLSKGVRVGVHSPWISHLLFADDCIVFSEASQRGANRLQEILDTYSRGSGQLVNRDKSAVFFSSNCTDQMKAEIRQGLQIEQEALAEKYLGLPTAVGHSTSQVFEYLPTRIRNLVGTWSGRDASCAGREVLLKSVAQVLPTYTMSCFLLPVDTCKKMRSIIGNYWWGSSADNQHIHWQRWERLIQLQPKARGGIGFRDLRSFNLAMLGKQGWRLMVNPESLCARVLKGKYYHTSDFMSATKKKNASHTWHAILTGRKVLQMGCIRRIGDGQSTNVWSDQWLPGGIGLKPVSRMDGATAERVCDLLSPDGRSWDENALNQNLVPLDAAAAQRIPLGRPSPDARAWSGERHAPPELAISPCAPSTWCKDYGSVEPLGAAYLC